MTWSSRDLLNFLDCKRLVQLDREVDYGMRPAPDTKDDGAELIARRAQEHERTILSREPVFGAHGSPEETLDAMRSGAPLIHEPAFRDAEFEDRAAFLRRIEHPSDLGAWSYEVLETRLALAQRPAFVLELLHLSEHLRGAQGLAPERGHVLLGRGDAYPYELSRYAAYYRRLRNAFLRFVQERRDEVYPDPCERCERCRWNDACAKQRHDDDHLSLIPWMRREQSARLQRAGITSVAQLASSDAAARPTGISSSTFSAHARHARLQVRARNEGALYEVREHEPGEGFDLMPPPNTGDLFFDMEGDPFFEPGCGLEYLFGCWAPADGDAAFHAFWGTRRDDEKTAFEQFVDFVQERRARDPALHVYHYGEYEKSALRRLAQRHATREDAVDDFLRSGLLVDLYAVVRQSLVISEERYSIKRLERYYGFTRLADLRSGDDSILMFERWLLDRSQHETLAEIERYNREDCRSTHALRDWLLALRGDRPFAKREPHPLPPPDVAQTQTEAALLANAAPAMRLLGHLLAYHRREEKPAWWQFFDRCENSDRLAGDAEALGDLEFDPKAALEREKRSTIYTYCYPEQQHAFGAGDSAVNPATQKTFGSIVAVDHAENRIRIKSTADVEAARALRALIPPKPIPPGEQRKALLRIGRAALDGTLASTHPVIVDLLTASAPRLREREPGAIVQPQHPDAPSIGALLQSLASSYLFIQGPPGTGKTTTGSSFICDLLARGARIGVTSNSHKAIHHLLHGVERIAQARGMRFAGLYKHSAQSTGSPYVSPLGEPSIRSVDKYDELDGGAFDLCGGTSYLFARESMINTLDYLIVDEAGQMSLADALAVAASARNVVLLGDPLQLAQVSAGSHPDGAGASVLEHLLGTAATVAPERGVFLEESHRMHPDICRFISERMYEGRLQAAPGTKQNAVSSPGLCGSGLRYMPTEHRDNIRSSVEEAEAIAGAIALLLQGELTDASGTRPFKEHDCIVVTPYNAQRRLIEARLHARGIDVAVGTVDKFQGQQAQVVFYSLAASNADAAPRGMEFLLERNRFNVAISRARALAVLVCSPALLDAPCADLERMEAANLLCSFFEQAQLIPKREAQPKTPVTA